LGAAHGWISWYVSSGSDKSIVMMKFDRQILYGKSFLDESIFYVHVYWNNLTSLIFRHPPPDYIDVADA
jgi:hypothetical protein